MTTTQPTRTLTWPRRAVLGAEALAATLAAAVAAGLAAGVSALAGIDAARPLLAVASGFVVGAVVRIAKDATQLWATYRNWRGHQLDQLCARLETRRARRRWSHTPQPANERQQRPAAQLARLDRGQR